jgi:hypothetical protein
MQSFKLGKSGATTDARTAVVDGVVAVVAGAVAVVAGVADTVAALDGAAAEPLGAGEPANGTEVELDAAAAIVELGPPDAARLEPQPPATNARTAAAIRIEDCMMSPLTDVVPLMGNPSPAFHYR